jgi:hypothetical protein
MLNSYSYPWIPDEGSEILEIIQRGLTWNLSNVSTTRNESRIAMLSGFRLKPQQPATCNQL